MLNLTRPLSFSTIEIELLIKSSAGYLAQYKAMQEFGKNASSVRDIQILALSVYGWMPTILQSVQFSVESLEQARRITDSQSREVFLQNFSTAPINSSWVGSSKFLHFINPDKFSIWDSHIARAFDLSQRHKYERREAYMTYLETLDGMLPTAEPLIREVTEMVRIQFGYKMSPLRALEFLIFSSSREVRRGANLLPS